jgi:hypothetical protein
MLGVTGVRETEDLLVAAACRLTATVDSNVVGSGGTESAGVGAQPSVCGPGRAVGTGFGATDQEVGGSNPFGRASEILTSRALQAILVRCDSNLVTAT